MKTYKRVYDRQLKHIKSVLSRERRSLPVNEWLNLVQVTKDCILNAPEDFFGTELPERSLLREAVDKVFESFLEDQRLLANQTSKRFRIPVAMRSK